MPVIERLALPSVIGATTTVITSAFRSGAVVAAAIRSPVFDLCRRDRLFGAEAHFARTDQGAADAGIRSSLSVERSKDPGSDQMLVRQVGVAAEDALIQLAK